MLGFSTASPSSNDQLTLDVLNVFPKPGPQVGTCVDPEPITSRNQNESPELDPFYNWNQN